MDDDVPALETSNNILDQLGLEGENDSTESKDLKRNQTQSKPSLTTTSTDANTKIGKIPPSHAAAPANIAYPMPDATPMRFIPIH